jgi:hypothetical protein
VLALAYHVGLFGGVWSGAGDALTWETWPVASEVCSGHSHGVIRNRD